MKNKPNGDLLITLFGVYEWNDKKTINFEVLIPYANLSKQKRTLISKEIKYTSENGKGAFIEKIRRKNEYEEELIYSFLQSHQNTKHQTLL